MNKSQHRAQTSWYVTVLCLFSMFTWWISGKTNGNLPTSIPNLIVETKKCLTSSTHNKEQFFIFSGGKEAASMLNDVACNNKVINKQFGSVKSFWHINDSHTLQIIGKGIADLALVKENIMSALKSEETHGYTKIASYPKYQAYLIARKERPVLTKNYFLDKRIALLNYPTSRSGHIIPVQIFTELGLSLEKLDIVYARSHKEMRTLLYSGDVDIISSYWQAEDEALFSTNYRIPISSPVSGSSWYIKLTNRNDDLLCASQSMLLQLSTGQSQNYYKSLNLIPFAHCNMAKTIPELNQ
ncbi:PhnD/SsuA/transferrin family substrate-binding protein [Psychrosphaera sp. B3R10]|uniref:PhnD/SsuA/transferrin family substrate-binding protein n=1 Tax=unclassified Psychrosphaera TaxID=2641570 RepID=UPI001C09F7BD|nr:MULTISPECIES: PhnD/SsuA/transferrin family substrate-binding protein [unclassified Psychrosphaera]MBU2883874.1 PhnD/SsuA/transferrin family substrate-binding protein [Psychrosphaera sp. I2R16]MBU2988737.1 PhnD/SsuA/transferrin family substrate-binding protein [Psychrosphaera sp. B3R10]